MTANVGLGGIFTRRDFGCAGRWANRRSHRVTFQNADIAETVKDMYNLVHVHLPELFRSISKSLEQLNDSKNR